MGYSTPQKGNFKGNFSGNLHFSIFQGWLAKEWYHVGKFLRSRKLHGFLNIFVFNNMLDTSDHETIVDLGIHPYFHLSKHGYITLLLSLLDNFDTYFWHQKSLMTTKVQLISISWTLSRFSNIFKSNKHLAPAQHISRTPLFSWFKKHSRLFRWRFSLPETNPLMPGWWASRGFNPAISSGTLASWEKVRGCHRTHDGY